MGRVIPQYVTAWRYEQLRSGGPWGSSVVTEHAFCSTTINSSLHWRELWSTMFKKKKKERKRCNCTLSTGVTLWTKSRLGTLISYYTMKWLWETKSVLYDFKRKPVFCLLFFVRVFQEEQAVHPLLHQCVRDLLSGVFEVKKNGESATEKKSLWPTALCG